jgi:transcriptional regulator with XRE-family HTH domain
MVQQRPRKLGDKLRAIRKHKRWTLDRMAEMVGRTDIGRRSRVYEWEQGIRRPDLKSLLAYARLIDVSTDILIDDELELKLEDE